MANHASTKATQLYDRRQDEMSLDEVEWQAADCSPRNRCPRPRDDTARREPALQLVDQPELEIGCEHQPDRICLDVVDDERTSNGV